jgi:hypothetical protein
MSDHKANNDLICTIPSAPAKFTGQASSGDGGLPLYAELTDEQIGYVSTTIKDFFLKA